MKHLLLIAVFLAGAPLGAQAATSLTRHGVTWTFDKDYTAGQYANGDWWVVGPVVITQITPTPTAGRNGTMVNPSRGRAQGFDDRIWGNTYSASLNAGTNLPLNVAANSSVVSSISKSSTSTYTQFDAFVILTVVDSAPAPGSFRPPYIGDGSRASRWKAADLDYSALNTLNSSALSSKPSISTVAGYFDKTWYEQDLTWTGRYLHTSYMAPSGYGRDMASRTGDAALLLNLDYTNAEKQTLLIRLVQYGIDINGILNDGGRWYDTGGHNIGRFSPLLVAAATLDDAELKRRCDGSLMNFSEFCQTFFVSQADVDQPRYTADGRPRLPYTTADIGMPEWGETHNDNPSRDGNNWNAYYRDTCGGQLTGPALAARVMGLRALVNWEPFFQYQERHLNYEQSAGYGGEFNSNPTPAFHKQFFNTHKNAMPGSSGPPTNPPPSGEFATGDRIEVTANTNVRVSGELTATLLGVQVAGSTGTIVGGPVGPDSNNIIWWQVDFDSGVDGWTGQDNYIGIVPGKPVTPSDFGIDLAGQGAP